MFFSEFLNLSSEQCLGLLVGVLLTCGGVQTLAVGAEVAHGPANREPLLQGERQQRSYSEGDDKRVPVEAEACGMSLRRVATYDVPIPSYGDRRSLACLDFHLTRSKSS